MCNLSSGIREEGIRDGILIGEINTLRDMLKAGLTTIEKLKESGLYSPDVLAALSNWPKPPPAHFHAGYPAGQDGHKNQEKEIKEVISFLIS